MDEPREPQGESWVAVWNWPAGVWVVVAIAGLLLLLIALPVILIFCITLYSYFAIQF
jgi:hypothetical protein